MRIDLHCHTKYSGDSMLEPTDLIRRARELGLDGVGVTEHNSYQASEPIERIAGEEGFVVLRGVEISSSVGHLIIFGVEDDSLYGTRTRIYRNVKAESVIEAVVAHGGVIIPSHPFRDGGLYSAGRHVFRLKDIVTIEALNGQNTDSENRAALDACRQMGISGTGGSDCHFTGWVGTCITEFDNDISNEQELIVELKAGNFRALKLHKDGTYGEVT